MLCLVALTTGCKEKEDNVQKANSLMDVRNLNIGRAQSLDSVFDYPKSFDYMVKGALIREDASSFVKEKIRTLTSMREKGMIEEMYKLARRTKEKATNMFTTAMYYDQEAALIVFKNEMDGVKKDFLGYSYTSKNDSCSYTVYFDKNLSEILCVNKRNNNEN